MRRRFGTSVLCHFTVSPVITLRINLCHFTVSPVSPCRITRINLCHFFVSPVSPPVSPESTYVISPYHPYHPHQPQPNQPRINLCHFFESIESTESTLVIELAFDNSDNRYHSPEVLRSESLPDHKLGCQRS